MNILHTIKETREFLAQARRDEKTIGLVPTMGYFHEGHLSLMCEAKAQSDIVVVSLFVNPTQFGPNEDFKVYPRDLDRDARMAESAGVDMIFNPSPEEMYPAGYHTYVDVEKLGEGLCGASRAGHFRGVSTVVLKLFNIVQPDRAYFGLKDYQQLKIIGRMVQDLNVPVQVVPMPIFREADGLAMSSRNVYLSPDERKAALILSKALAYAQSLVDEGVTSVHELNLRIVEFISQEPLSKIDYVEIVDAETLECPDKIEGNAVLALAVRIGKTRLIDNAVLVAG